MNARSLLCVPLFALALPAQAPGLATARLEGQVVDAMHQPVGKALVVAELDGEEIARTQSDASGTFVFAKVPQQFVVVRATTATPDIGAVQVDLLGETQGFARIVLMPARKVSGVVKDETGKPIAGAWVVASPSDAPDLGHASCIVQTGPDGRYELTHVAMGPAFVRAWTPEHDAFEGKVDGVGDVVLDCGIDPEVEQEQTFELVGGTAAQIAAAHLLVAASREDVPLPLPPPLARPSPARPGHWIVRGWPYGDELRVRVVVPGATVDPAEHTTISGVGNVERRFTVDNEGSRIVGVLHGGDGVAAGGVRLLAQSLTQPLGNGSRCTTVSAPDGSFVLQSPVERGDSFALRSLSPVVVLQGNNMNLAWFLDRHAGGNSLRLELRRSHTVRLRVVTPSLVPVAGADVRLARTEMPPPVDRRWRRSSTDGAIGEGITDLDGRLSIESLSVAADTGFRCAIFASSGCLVLTLRTSDGTTTEVGTVVVEAGSDSHGVVRGDDGAPLAGARVRVPDRGRSGIEYVLVTDRAGRWRQPALSSGSYQVKGNTWEDTWVDGRGQYFRLPRTPSRRGR